MQPQTQMTIDVYKVWEFYSYAWTEIGIEADECRSLASTAGVTPHSLNKATSIFYRDVCASIAVDSFLIFPLMMWMIMPDWGYEEVYLRRRVQNWYAKPYWTHFLNPLRVLGYPIAILFARGYPSRLKKATTENAAQKG